MGERPNVIANTVVGILSCPRRHNHGTALLNLRYRLDRPLEVGVAITTGEHTYHHVVSRDLLCDAYGSHAADSSYIFGEAGFVTLKVRDGYSWQVVIRVYGLTPDDVPGYGEIITPRTPVVEFLNRTLLAVPRGAERTDRELDRELQFILEGGI